MKKRLILLPIFFFAAITTLSFTISFVNTLHENELIARAVNAYQAGTINTSVGFISALPSITAEVIGSALIYDQRAETLQRFFTTYNSPLGQHAKFFVEVADKYGLDYRLLPAIAMQESSGGRFIPPGSYNAWGYAITETQTLGFLSWEQAIDNVARGIRKNYINQGLVTPEQIMTKYTPDSIEKGGAWAKGVDYFMSQME